MFPAKDALNICFAHVAYQMQERFAPRETGIANFQVRDRAGLEARIGGLTALRGFFCGLLVRMMAARAFAMAGGPLTMRGLYGRLRKVLRALMKAIGEARRAVARRRAPLMTLGVARARRLGGRCTSDKVTQKTVLAAGCSRA